MITKNVQKTVENSLLSVKNLVDEIIVVDDSSSDNTVEIAKKHGAKVFIHKEESLGKQRAYGLNKATNDWVLTLDSDEIISPKLKAEIKSKVKSERLKIEGFYIPFQNHFLGRPIKFGGESYKKLILFNKNKVKIDPLLVHEKFIVRGETGILKNKIIHHSYRSLPQMFKKFTDYAVKEAKQKSSNQEKSSLKKVLLYPLHMFWARFIKDQGYKDGLFRIPLDIGFAYMEFLTYFLLLSRFARRANFKITDENLKTVFIIVTYKTSESEVKRLKQEIKNIGLKDYQIYFFDNSIDNKGFAYQVNQGIRQGLIYEADYFVIANPDISLKGITKELLLNGGEKFDICGGVIRKDNKIYYGGVIDRLHLTGGLISHKPKEQFYPVDFVSGSLMIIKKDVIKKIGFFDERFFMYYEDVDYCYLAKKAGFKVGINCDLVYRHYELSQSNPKKEVWLNQSRWQFFKKHSQLKHKIYDFFFQKKNLVNFLSFNFSSFINKCLNFILFIFLIKYLKVEEYGIYNLIWTQVAILAPIVDLGTTSYGLVYLPTEKKEQFGILFNLRLILAMVVFFVTLISAFFIFSHQPNLVFYTFLLSFSILANMFSGSYLIITSIEQKLFLSSFLSIVFNLFLITDLIIGLVLKQNIRTIFLIIFVFYNLYSIINYWLLRRYLKGLVYQLFNLSWVKIFKKSYLFVLIGIFANLYFKIDLFLLNFLIGKVAVAIYSAGYKFLEALFFIAASYTISATPILAKLAKTSPNNLITKVKRDGVLLFILGLIISLLIFYLGPVFLALILREGYQHSIKVAQIVSLALPFILINTVFYNILYVLNRANIVVYLFLFQFIVNTVLNLIFIPYYGIFASAYLTVLSEIINCLIGFYFVYENINGRRHFVPTNQSTNR